MKQSPTRLADVALLATLLSGAVTVPILIISELWYRMAKRTFAVPPLISFLVVGFLLLGVTQVFYSRLKKARKSGTAKGVPWQRVFTGFLTALIPVLAYLVLRTGRVTQDEWLAFFYVSVLLAILIPHLIVRAFDFVMCQARLRESSPAAHKERLS